WRCLATAWSQTSAFTQMIIMGKTFVFFLAVFFLCATSGISRHGRELYQVVDDEVEGRELAPDQQSARRGKPLTQPALEEGERWWDVSLSTGWTSRQVYYGVDVTGNSGAYTTDLEVRVQNLTLNVWSAFGTGNDYQEWDFTAAYTFETKWVFFTPGYNFYYQPGVVNDGNSEPVTETHGHHEHSGDHEHPQHTEPEQSHGFQGNEIFFVLGTKAIPNVIPSMLFVCDLNNVPGSILEFRLAGDIPLVKDLLVLESYALLGINLGYNTPDYFGWNNFEVGLRTVWKINRFVSIHGGINYSVALTALEKIDEGNVLWASTGVRFTY
ncbi:MAG TPA: hypothetical protein VIS99_06795, partial [Terrimicrobiaceae bacterium]